MQDMSVYMRMTIHIAVIAPAKSGQSSFQNHLTRFFGGNEASTRVGNPVPVSKITIINEEDTQLRQAQTGAPL